MASSKQLIPGVDAIDENSFNLPGNQDSVNLSGITPITPQSFAPGSPLNPGTDRGMVRQYNQDLLLGANPNQNMYQPQMQRTNALSNQSAPQMGLISTPEDLENDTTGQAPINLPEINVGPEPAMQRAAATGTELPKQPEFGTSMLGPMQTPEESAKIFNSYIENSDEARRALMQNNMDKAQVHQQAAEEQRLQLRHSDQEWALAQTEQQKREKAMDDAIAKGRAMSIDPNRYWKKAGTASNILSALSVGLGAFASGMTHGATGNPGLAMLNQAIENDINAQKEDLDNYWGSVKQQFQLNDNAFNRALANQNFRANQRLAANKIVEMDLSGIEAKSQNPIVQQGAADLRYKLQMDQIGLRQQSAVAYLAMQKQAQDARNAAANAAALSAKDRNKSYQDLYDKNLTSGMSKEEASAAAWSDTDKMYPQLAGTKFASPGQQYDSQIGAVSKTYEDLQKKFNDPKTGQINRYNFLQQQLNQGYSEEEAKDAMNAIMKGTPSQFKTHAQSMLNQIGVKDPYQAATTGGIPGIPGINKKQQELVVNDPNTGNVLMYPSRESAEKARTALTGLAEVKSIVDELKSMRKANEGGTFDPTQVDHIKILNNRLIGAINAAHGGKLDENERKAWSSVIPDASSHDIITDTDKRLDLLEMSIVKSAQDQLKAQGGQVIGNSPTNQSFQVGFQPTGQPVINAQERNKKLQFTPTGK